MEDGDHSDGLDTVDYHLTSMEEQTPLVSESTAFKNVFDVSRGQLLEHIEKMKARVYKHQQTPSIAHGTTSC